MAKLRYEFMSTFLSAVYCWAHAQNVSPHLVYFGKEKFPQKMVITWHRLIVYPLACKVFVFRHLKLLTVYGSDTIIVLCINSRSSAAWRIPDRRMVGIQTMANKE